MNDPEVWADMSDRMADCYAALADWPKGRPLDLAMAAQVIRCAYAAGYSDALADPVPLPEARVAEARFRLALP